MKFLLALSVFVAMCCLEVDEFLVTCNPAPATMSSCGVGDTIKLFVHVEDWVNADSVNYDWTNGTKVEIITCDSLNSQNACNGSTFVDHKYFWSDEVKAMRFVNGGYVDIGLVWLPPSPIQDSIPYPVRITVYEDVALTIIKFGPYIAYPLYYNALGPDTNVPGYNESAKYTPNLCP